MFRTKSGPGVPEACHTNPSPLGKQVAKIYSKTSSPSSKLNGEVLIVGSSCPSIENDKEAQRTLRHVANMITYYNITGIKFVDKSFPVQARHVDNEPFGTTNELVAGSASMADCSNGVDGVMWYRPIDDGWTVIRNDVAPNDVQQGRIGDCWFITALAVASERPWLIMRLLLTDEINKAGAYCVRLCKDGEWTSVIVDDILPMSKKSGAILSSRGRRHQLWVCLLEKALAKISGGYHGIVAGRCAEGLALVTGAPCLSVILGATENREDKENLEEDDIWDSLIEAYRKRFLMCAMCSNVNLPESKFTEKGLIANHAYSVRKFIQTDTGKRSVQLVNPWKPRDTLSISFKDLIRFFDSVDVCRIRENPATHESDWLTRKFSGFFNHTAFSLLVKKPENSGFSVGTCFSDNRQSADIDLSLYRVLGQTRKRPDGESIVIMLVSHRNGSEIEFVKMSEKANSKSVSLIVDSLPPGSYTVIPAMFSKHVDSNGFLEDMPFNLTLHHHMKANVQIKPTNIEIPTLRKVLIAVACKNGRCLRLSRNLFVYDFSQGWDGILCVVENGLHQNAVKFEVYFHALNNVVHTRRRCVQLVGKDSVEKIVDLIPPKCFKIIFIASRDRPRDRFYIKHKYIYKVLTASSDWKAHIPNNQYMDALHQPVRMTSAKPIQ